MNYKEYAIESRKFDLTAEWPDAHRYVHAALGLISEYGELLEATDTTNRIEEAGDFCWYLRILCDLAHIDDIFTIEFAPIPKPIFFDIANTAKRWFVAGKMPPESQLREQVAQCLSILCSRCVDLNMLEVLDANIAKLNLRTANKTKTYAETADEAARDRAAEAKIIAQ